MISSRQFEYLIFVDELILRPNVGPAYPPNLPPPQQVHRFITLNCSLCCLEFSQAQLGVHSPFDGAAVLLDDVVQLRQRPVPKARAERPILVYIAGIAALRSGLKSVLTTRGCGSDRSLSDLRNSRLAASAARKAHSRKSIVAPAESMARYREHQRALTLR